MSNLHVFQAANGAVFPTEKAAEDFLHKLTKDGIIEYNAMHHFWCPLGHNELGVADGRVEFLVRALDGLIPGEAGYIIARSEYEVPEEYVRLDTTKPLRWKGISVAVVEDEDWWVEEEMK